MDFVLNRTAGFEVKMKATSQDAARLKTFQKEVKLKESYLISRHYSQVKHVLYPFQV